jgi:hypothetical protein
MDEYQIINNNNAFKEPTHGCQNCNTSQILVFGGYLKVRESLYTYYWVNNILKPYQYWGNLPRFGGSCMVSRPKW